MDAKKLAAAKSTIQRFLATVFADEVSPELYQALKSDRFLKNLKAVSAKFYSKELARGAMALFEFMERAGADTYQKLRYEYADLFLNAGNNPVFPYESFYADREPSPMTNPCFGCGRRSENMACIKIPAMGSLKITLRWSSIFYLR